MAAKRSYDAIPRSEQEAGRLESSVEPRPDLYALMDELIEEFHPDLAAAKVILVWRYGWKADDDGRLILGQFKRATSLEVQLHGYDAKILLNYEAWHGADFTELQQRALMDHELCHGALKLDGEGAPAVDPNTLRLKYRARKHDSEEFCCIAERYGLWTPNLERMAAAALKGARSHGQRELFTEDEQRPAPIARRRLTGAELPS